MTDADEKVNRLILAILRSGDHGWEGQLPPPHFTECPDVTVSKAEAELELWWDTGVDATRLTATLSCPHEGAVDWEWADLGDLPDLIEKMDKPSA